jgi:hypothetical protein
MGEVKQAPHRTITRRSDEPSLEIGQTISLEEGLVGVVLARYTRSGDVRHDYIVELRGRSRGILIEFVCSHAFNKRMWL